VIVELVPYDGGWAERFAEERALLTSSLRPWLHGGVHHVGSTAVPGLAAKPMLDMLAGVASLQRARAAIPVLADLGYAHSDHRAHEALWFAKPAGAPEAERTHQLHLTELGSRLWRERFAFRNALRSDPELRVEYETLKHQLAATEVEPRDYTNGKREMVRLVLARAGIEL